VLLTARCQIVHRPWLRLVVVYSSVALRDGGDLRRRCVRVSCGSWNYTSTSTTAKLTTADGYAQMNSNCIRQVGIVIMYIQSRVWNESISKHSYPTPVAMVINHHCQQTPCSAFGNY
jgi:hypothetical protein